MNLHRLVLFIIVVVVIIVIIIFRDEMFELNGLHKKQLNDLTDSHGIVSISISIVTIITFIRFQAL